MDNSHIAVIECAYHLARSHPERLPRWVLSHLDSSTIFILGENAIPILESALEIAKNNLNDCSKYIDDILKRLKLCRTQYTINIDRGHIKSNFSKNNVQTNLQNFPSTDKKSVNIKIVSVGGGGSRIICHIASLGRIYADFIITDTDVENLKKTSGNSKIQLKEECTKGFSGCSDPMLDYQVAIESSLQIREAIDEADIVFVIACMGGGTGTGAAPVIAQLAKEMGKLTVALVTKPFTFEGTCRCTLAEAGIAKLHSHVDSLIVIPNDGIVALKRDMPFGDMLKKINDILFYEIKNISEMLMMPGLDNLTYTDVIAIIGESGLALVGSEQACGKSRARMAAECAIFSPLLLKDFSISDAHSVFVNITIGSPDINPKELLEIREIFSAATSEATDVFFSVVFDKSMGDSMRVTFIAIGVDSRNNFLEPLTSRTSNLASASATGRTMRRETKEPRNPSGEDFISDEEDFDLSVNVHKQAG